MNKQIITNNIPLIANDEFLLVSSLSVADSMARIKAMANRDLKIEVHTQSNYHAEVQLTERYNDDLPLAIILRLRAVANGTNIIVNHSPYPEQKPDFFANLTPKTAQKIKQIALYSLITAILCIAMGKVLYLMIPILCLSPFAIVAVLLDVESTVNFTTGNKNRKMSQLTQERYERLKADIHRTLPIVPINARYDSIRQLGHES